MKQAEKKESPHLTVTFPDGSVFELPEEWEDVFLQYFGEDSLQYEKVTQRLCFVTGKYMEHKAFPSNFDGLQWMREDRPIDAAAYDNPEFYWEKWDEWGEQGKNWNRESGNISNPPTWADVAEGVMYQELRSGLLQESLQKWVQNCESYRQKHFLKR